MLWSLIHVSGNQAPGNKPSYELVEYMAEPAIVAETAAIVDISEAAGSSAPAAPSATSLPPTGTAATQPPAAASLPAGAAAAQPLTSIDDGLWDKSKTEFSRVNAGQNSYYYWHGDAERRRQTGETAVPLPVPHMLASGAVAKQKPVKAIDTFTFLDDDNVVKVYISLEGALADVRSSDVETEFSERSLAVTINTPEATFKFLVDRLTHSVDALRCKASITKSRKLLLKLFKRSHLDKWAKLRASS